MDKDSKLIKKIGQYGLSDYLEIVSELSDQSFEQGMLSHLQKELIALSLSIFKNCPRCIEAHEQTVKQLEGTDSQINLVEKVTAVMNSAPESESEYWPEWAGSWIHESASVEEQYKLLRELTALAISIVAQHEQQIDLHLIAALENGASIEQILEIVPIVLLMDGAPTLSQIPRLFECYENLQNDGISKTYQEY